MVKGEEVSGAHGGANLRHPFFGCVPAGPESLNEVRAAHAKGCALMQGLRIDVHHAAVVIFSEPTGLLCDEGQGRAFVQQPQFSFGVCPRRWVEVDPAFDEVAVKICHERTDVTC